MSNISQYYESLCEVHRPLFVCNSETELVVEGFPRSANTFFVDFLHLNNQTKVAHHTNKDSAHFMGESSLAFLNDDDEDSNFSNN